jgi:hypothetical protein
MGRRVSRAEKTIVALSVAGGVVLCVIGLRFLIVPEAAASFFGIEKRSPGFAPHAAIALRDLWLGLLLITLALRRDWSGVGFWFGLGTLVCFGDAAIAASSSGRWGSIVFHVISGLACLVIAAFVWSHARRWVDPRPGS